MAWMPWLPAVRVEHIFTYWVYGVLTIKVEKRDQISEEAWTGPSGFNSLSPSDAILATEILAHAMASCLIAPSHGITWTNIDSGALAFNF